MRFALVNGKDAEAAPKLKGICRCCSGETVSKCGRYKVWHWAHKSKSPCDNWWEKETQWHRDWKNNFPSQWQEVVHFDTKTGEKHIADVKTEHGLVIELQHSLITPEEMTARENFYGNIVWIVDGCRNDLDKTCFHLGRSDIINKPNSPSMCVFDWYHTGKLFHRWSFTEKPVFIDFGEDILWRLVFFDCQEKKGIVGPVRKEEQIQALINNERLPSIERLRQFQQEKALIEPIRN